MDNEKIKEFLKELAELTEKHGIEIYSCGHCEALVDLKDDKIILAEGLRYIKDTKEYEIR